MNPAEELQLINAYFHGRAAALRGQPLSACPFPDLPRAGEWERGHTDQARARPETLTELMIRIEQIGQDMSRKAERGE